MNIAALSMAMNQSKVSNQAQILVMKQMMNVQANQATALTDMLQTVDTAKIQQIAQPHLGGTIDIKG